MSKRALAVVVAAGLALAVTLPGRAPADGDPASDYLPIFNVFLPVAQGSATSKHTSLQQAVDAVYAKHSRIKVAVVASAADLGAIPSLFNKPTEYARFLGQELRTFYIGPLLIVMPSGFGIYDGGRSTALEQAVLAHQPTAGTTVDELAGEATAAVKALLAAHTLASKDVLAPIVQPGSNLVRPGKPTRLHYSVIDDSGYAAVRVTVVRLHRTIASFNVPLRRVDAAKIYAVGWRVPRTVRNPIGLCLNAKDGSGNRSGTTCTAIPVR